MEKEFNALEKFELFNLLKGIRLRLSLICMLLLLLYIIGLSLVMK